jgi:hypothetical protein
VFEKAATAEETRWSDERTCPKRGKPAPMRLTAEELMKSSQKEDPYRVIRSLSLNLSGIVEVTLEDTDVSAAEKSSQAISTCD